MIDQARSEAGRHEARRAAAAEKLTTAASSGNAGGLGELATTALALTRRAAIMEVQVDVLDSKRRALVRFRDALAGLAGLPGGQAAAPGTAPSTGDAGPAPEMSRVVLSAQEDLRREIARAMHDGPAQSLTNIVLQAQIVERLVGADPARAKSEARQLIDMVQHTLEATKSFIFDVRPMVLDDLGLVPTLRRAARDRGRRAGVTVEFESSGRDRRLEAELESALFRILDEALAGYVAAGAARVRLRLEWSETLTAEVAGEAPAEAASAEEPVEAAPAKGRDRRRAPEPELPAALAAMVEERRHEARAAAETARRAAIPALAEETWRGITARAASLEIAVELIDDGTRLRVSVPLSSDAAAGS